MTGDIYKCVLDKVKSIKKSNNITDVDEVGLLYYLSIDAFFDDFYFPILSSHQKEYYGEVNTPLILADELVAFLNLQQYTDNLPAIADSGAGMGYISAVLVKRLFNVVNPHSHSQTQTDGRQRWISILKNITLIEINEDNCAILKLFFGRHATIVCGDYLNYFPSLDMNKNGEKYDIVIGNPPFNINGSIKVPTNSSRSKKEDGKTIWREFVYHSLNYVLKPGGLLCYFMPSLWLKSDDKSGLFNYILRENKLLRVKCYSNTESNSLFKGHAQTHCGCFLIKTGGITDEFEHYSHYLKQFSRCALSKRGTVKSICVLDSTIERKIINKLEEEFIHHGLEYKTLTFNKTSTLSKKILISPTQNDVCKFKNIQTCVFSKCSNSKYGNPILKYEYSDCGCAFYGDAKIILPHGMYGIPFIDKNGEYGISRRDKYVILSDSVQDMECVAWFLSTPLANFMFENYKYRMCFLEKAGFEWLCDISLLVEHGFPYKNIDAMYKWFNLTEDDIEYINRFIVHI